MATDAFERYARGLTTPADDAFAITPSDGADLAQVVRALYIGGAGSISLVTRAGSTVAFTGLAAGTVLPVRAARVRATGTTATGLVGLV